MSRPPGAGERERRERGESGSVSERLSECRHSLCSMFGPMYRLCSLLFIISSGTASQPARKTGSLTDVVFSV